MMLSRIEPRNRKLSWRTTPKSLAQMAQVDFLEVDAVELEEAAIVAVDPLQQPRDRRFSRAAAPDDAEHGSGRNVEG